MVLIRVNSDSFQDALMTVEAYECVALEMSTGDSATHEARPIVMPQAYIEWDKVYQFDADAGVVIPPFDETVCEIWNPAVVA